MNKFIIILLFITQPAFGTVLPRPDHVIVVIEENKTYQQIVDNNGDAPYINELARRGMLFTNSHAVTHPSQPNNKDGTYMDTPR